MYYLNSLPTAQSIFFAWGGGGGHFNKWALLHHLTFSRNPLKVAQALVYRGQQMDVRTGAQCYVVIAKLPSSRTTIYPRRTALMSSTSSHTYCFGGSSVDVFSQVVGVGQSRECVLVGLYLLLHLSPDGEAQNPEHCLAALDWLHEQKSKKLMHGTQNYLIWFSILWWLFKTSKQSNFFSSKINIKMSKADEISIYCLSNHYLYRKTAYRMQYIFKKGTQTWWSPIQKL